MTKQEIYILLGIGAILLLVLLRLLWKDTMYEAMRLPHVIKHDGRKYGYGSGAQYWTDTPGNYSDTPRGADLVKSTEKLLRNGPRQ